MVYLLQYGGAYIKIRKKVNTYILETLETGDLTDDEDPSWSTLFAKVKSNFQGQNNIKGMHNGPSQVYVLNSMEDCQIGFKG